MDNQTKIIIGLVVLVIVLAGIFFLKSTGKIRTTEKEKIKTEENIIENKETLQSSADSQSSADIYMIAKKTNSFTKKYSIIISIIIIILNIGIAKLYTKIGMPMWTVVLQIVSPILSLINVSIIETIIGILNFVSSILLFKTLDAFQVELGEYKTLLITATAFIAVIMFIVTKSILYTISLTGILLLIIIAIIFDIKMCSNLADEFNKGKGFKLGLIILPTIFQAILGYQNNNV